MKVLEDHQLRTCVIERQKYVDRLRASLQWPTLTKISKPSRAMSILKADCESRLSKNRVRFKRQFGKIRWKVRLLVDIFTFFLPFASLVNLPLSSFLSYSHPPEHPLIMSLSGKDVERDGFIYGLEGFRAYPGPMKRIEGPQLRLMFLPKLTYQAQTLFRSNPGLVRSQLRHYGVPFDENNFAGRGTVLLKKVLEQGQCDQVPLSITLLQDEMLQEWLHQCILHIWSPSSLISLLTSYSSYRCPTV